MDQHGDCTLRFPIQGSSDGHAFVFQKSSLSEEISFQVGEGCDGEMNKLLGDGLNLEDQLKLICQFCKNPNLKHLSIYINGETQAIWNKIVYGSIKLLLWTTLMKELQGCASLEYIEFQGFPYIVEDRKIYMRTMVEMLNTNSSLLGLKIWTRGMAMVDLKLFMKPISTNKTLQLLHLIFYGSRIEAEAIKLLMASLTPDLFGYQSNTTLRALFMDYISLGIHIGHSNEIAKSLMEAFINMLETNKTLTTIQIPTFLDSVEDIVKALNALQVNQSIRNIFLGSNFLKRKGFYEEFSREEVFSGLLKLIKFRNDHGNGLNMVDVQHTSLDKPKFDVHIQGALKKKYYNDGNHGEFFVRPMSCRVFLCGFPKAGKTTLRKKMNHILREKPKKFHLIYSLSKRVELPSTHVSKRTIGVEVVTYHVGAIELSLWDMGGQDEYHAYHDLVIPNLSDIGSASLFILVCSMATIKDGAKCSNAKSTKAIELELQYWLCFLSSNTRTSRNFKLHVLVAFTHVDVLPKPMNVERHVEDLLASIKKKFGDFFHFSSMEYFVNSNSIQMVEPLVECVAKEVEVVLAKVPNIFAACLEMRDKINKGKGDHPCQTIIKWKDFVDMCWELPWLKKAIPHLDANVANDICKTIASSLHEGGYIIYFEDLDVIVMDPNWFGTKIIGSIFSIDHKCLDPHTKEPLTNEKGYMERDKLVSVLKNSFKDKKGVIKKGANMTQHVDVDDLICVMKEMNVCFEEHSTLDMERPKKLVFIPAILRDEGGLAHQGQRQLKWNVMGSSSSGRITYIGRRLQCEDLE